MAGRVGEGREEVEEKEECGSLMGETGISAPSSMMRSEMEEWEDVGEDVGGWVGD